MSQLRIVHPGLHLVTYLDVGNFCDKSTVTSWHEICVQVFLRFSDSSKPSQSVSLIYELAWLAEIGKFEKNLLKTSYKVAPVIKVAHIFWWHHDNRKQSASACEHWSDVSCDIPYWPVADFRTCGFPCGFLTSFWFDVTIAQMFDGPFDCDLIMKKLANMCDVRHLTIR